MTRTQNQLYAATPISSFAQCLILFRLLPSSVATFILRCPSGYRNGYLASHALGHMIYGCNIVRHVPKCISYHKAIVVRSVCTHYFHIASILHMPWFYEI